MIKYLDELYPARTPTVEELTSEEGRLRYAAMCGQWELIDAIRPRPPEQPSEQLDGT